MLHWLIKEFIPEVENAYRSKSVEFYIEYGDILDIMADPPNAYKIIDLDLMGWLSKEKVDKIAHGMKCCATPKNVLAVWHSIDRSKDGGYYRVDNEYRPYLLKKIRKDWEILVYNKVEYRESQDNGGPGYPMFVEVFTLERKWKAS